MTIEELIGSPRAAAISGTEFRLVPHRTNDSQDTPGVWVWKLEVWEMDEVNRLVGVELL